jgi:hypothetical protein
MRTAMGPSTMVDNALSRYDRQVRAAVDLLDPRPPSEGFDPGTALSLLSATTEAGR